MLLKNLNDLDENGNIGDWCFSSDRSYMFIRYGKDIEDTCTVKIRGEDSWQWNGDEECPTIHPSILVSGIKNTVLWHGYMKNGILETV